MSSLDIGLTGLSAARKALDVIGNNVANAASEGYHRQRVELTPSDPVQDQGLSWGTGVRFDGITRVIDTLLEQEIMRQESNLQAVSQELTALRTVETSIGEFGTSSGINASIDAFFSALHDLAAHPNEETWSSQFVRTAESMTFQFRALGETLTDLSTRIIRETESLITQVNAITTEIADLNQSIEDIEITGAVANGLRDQRDRKIANLADLITVDIHPRQYGVVDVSAAGIPVVVGSQNTDLVSELTDITTLGVGASGATNPVTVIAGGKIGGLLAAKNTMLPEIKTKLDTLAKAITDQINQYHVQGVGPGGSFASLTGWNLGASTSTLADLDSDITAGDINIRITNTSTGAVSRETVTIAVTTDTLASVIADINALTGVTASVSNNQVQIVATSGYSFDFLPAVLPTPENTTLGGSSPPTITTSGLYSDTSNKTFTFSVSGAGTVGAGALSLSVSDGSSTIATFNIGTGYAAGDKLDLGNGLKIALTTGNFASGDNFQVNGYAATDTTGFLAAAGINTFFSGNTLDSMSIVSRIANDTRLVATALGSEYADNTNIQRMANLQKTTVSTLNNLTISDYYQSTVSGLGQDISVKESRENNLESVIQNLNTRRTTVSGVDINEEAAKILMFEQMFRAMAKYINTINEAMQTLMNAM